MTISLIFLTLLMVTFGGWLFLQSINVSPWEAERNAAGPVASIPDWATAPRVGLLVFLAAVTSLFALTLSAYMMRLEQLGAEWHSLPVPGLLWLNSALLALASLSLQAAWNAARNDRYDRLRPMLTAGGLLSLGFALGQIVVWRQLHADGYYLAGNPANAFFYLLTALHGVHLLGGLVAWARILAGLQAGAEPARLRASIELCAIYWHYLLLVWVVVFGLVLTT
jgi:cytochrome c oxidase subunit 3